jgi:hypothetical protein
MEFSAPLDPGLCVPLGEVVAGFPVPVADMREIAAAEPCVHVESLTEMSCRHR